MPDQIETYVETAMDQVRWKKARPGLAAEIRTHLLDQRDACLAQGMDEGAAQGEAVRQMGDPVALGTDLDRVHRPRPQWGLLVFALALAALGTLVRLVLTMDTPSATPGLTHIIGGVLGRAVCLGGLTALGVQAVFSLLLNLGVPLFAASFPLVVGNTGTVLNMFFIGLMLSAFRDGAMPEERPAERLLTVPAVSWVDGVLTVNFKGRTLSE